MKQHLFALLLLAPALLLANLSRADQVDDYIKAEMDQRRIPGAALMVIQNGKAIKTAAYGLANIELPAPKCQADPRFGPDLIIELVHKYPRQITLVPVGPLTNIALALSKDPSIAGLVKEVVMMGGSISGGNVNASAEANIYGDPEAASIVFAIFSSSP